MPRRRRNHVLIAILSTGIFAAAVSSAFFWHRFESLVGKQAEAASTILRLEHATGYSGFIHDFKNAVLRPQEPIYLESALTKYDVIQSILADLETLAASEDVAIDLGLFRKALTTYRANIRVLTSRRYDSTRIAEADALVRVPDGAARANLDNVTRKLTQTLADKLRPVESGLYTSLVATIILVTLLVREITYNARMREEYQLMLNQQHLLEVERRHRRELAASLTQLRQINREQAEFSYAVAHDLKAPTNTANMLVDALQEEAGTDLPPDAAEFLNNLHEVLRRMSCLIEDMQGYANTFSSDEQRTRVALDEVLDMVIAELQSDISAARAQVHREPLPLLTASPTQMRNLLRNLLQNAIKFRAPGSQPVIAVTPAPAADGEVAFSIHDNGIGIPPDQIDRIFSLFGRLHGRELYEGTGLGLSICQRIARTHGGDIAVTSTEGAGSTFTVTMKAA